MGSHTTIPQGIMLSINLPWTSLVSARTRTVWWIYVWSPDVCIGYIQVMQILVELAYLDGKNNVMFFSWVRLHVLCKTLCQLAEVYFCLPPPGSSDPAIPLGQASERVYIFFERRKHRKHNCTPTFQVWFLIPPKRYTLA